MTMAKGAGRPKITNLSHMTFQSSDVEKALAYYRDLHGWEEQLLLKGRGGAVERAFVMINEAQWVELRPEHAPKTDRLVQFGFQVEDAEAVRAYLASRGVAVPAAVGRHWKAAPLPLRNVLAIMAFAAPAVVSWRIMTPALAQPLLP